MQVNETRTIVWLDNDFSTILPAVHYLEDHGFQVERFESIVKFYERIDAELPNLIVVDILMPHDDEISQSDSHGGHLTGLAVARTIRSKHPDAKIAACTVVDNDDVTSWFHEFGSGHWLKQAIRPNRELLSRVQEAMSSDPSSIEIFIVHGHNETAKLDLKNYLQNTLNVRKVTVLHEQPSLGKTIMEKFEHYAQRAHIVFVLLTPDDIAAVSGSGNTEKRRARQNVIFEMGYFMGLLRRLSGKVILLHEGDTELPSDIGGMIYIDISAGIESSGEQIRREISMLL